MVRLDLRPRCLDKEYATYLLYSYCSIWALYNNFDLMHTQDKLPKQFDLVAELLRREGDLNVYVEDFSTTIWGKFLRGVPWSGISAQTAWLVTMKTFLENGADIHVSNPAITEVSEPLQCKVKLRPVWYTKLRLQHEVSPLFSIRCQPEYTPELKELEEICLAKGGRSSMKLVVVAVEKDRDGWYKIPSRERDKLIAASNAASKATRPTCNNISFMPDLRMWLRELRRIYEENLEKDKYSDTRLSSDEDLSPNTDAEGEFYNSIST